LCIAALLAIPLGGDALSGVFAVILAMPWLHLLTNLVGDTGGDTAASFIMAGAGMGLNAVILWGLCRWFAGAVVQHKG
jgi:hypothetical protein